MSIFSCVYWPFVWIFLEKCLFRTLAQFLIGMFVFLTLICYILETNLFVICFICNYFFSHSKSCLLILFTVSFGMQKRLSVIQSHLLIVVFISFILGGRSKKILLLFLSKSVLPMFSTKSFFFFLVGGAYI